MKIREFLNHVCEQIKYEPIRKEISEEIENHLIEAKENYKLEGMKEEEAEETAIQQMGNAEEIGKKLNKIHRPKLDWKLVLLTIILIIFGGLVTFTRASNCYHYMDDTGRLPYHASMFQYIATVLTGLILGVIFYFLDYRKILKFSNHLYILATFLLIFTEKFGFQVNGSTSHISIYGFNIYAPMLAVILYLLAFIGFVQKINPNKNLKMRFLEKRKICISLDIFKIIILSEISLFLLLIIATVPAVILGMVYLIIATVKLLECTKNRKICIAILWGVSSMLGIVFMIFVLPIAWERLIVSFHPEQDPKGGGWIGVNQKMVLESANLFGEADNMSNALNVFDEGTNFAFISILAHYGWVVSGGMVIAIVAFSIKLMMNVVKIKDMYGKLLIVGISSLFILQSVFNLLMNLNLGIKSNVNIPFISYGRQELILNMLCLGLVLSVYRRKDILVKVSKQVV